MSQTIIDADAQRWQQSDESFQEVDGGGNWTRSTNGTIQDESATHLSDCITKIQTIVNETKTVKGHSTKKVSGVKKLFAGALKFLSSGSASMGAADNVNLTAGQDINIACAGKSLFKTMGERTVHTTLGVTDRALMNHNMKALKWWIGNDIESIPHLTAEFMQTVVQALQILESHTHPSVSAPSQETDIKNQRILAAAQKLRMDSIKE